MVSECSPARWPLGLSTAPSSISKSTMAIVDCLPSESAIVKVEAVATVSAAALTAAKARAAAPCHGSCAAAIDCTALVIGNNSRGVRWKGRALACPEDRAARFCLAEQGRGAAASADCQSTALTRSFSSFFASFAPSFPCKCRCGCRCRLCCAAVCTLCSTPPSPCLACDCACCCSCWVSSGQNAACCGDLSGSSSACCICCCWLCCCCCCCIYTSCCCCLFGCCCSWSCSGMEIWSTSMSHSRSTRSGEVLETAAMTAAVQRA